MTCRDDHQMSMSCLNNAGDRTAYGLLISLLLAEYLFFYTYASREIVWAYANNHDQAEYLLKTYTLWAAAAGGDLAAWVDHFREPLSTGLLFPFQGAVMCLLFGACRISCLSLNFIYFALLQTAVFFWTRSTAGNVWAGFVGVGLLLTQQTAFFWAGGLFDFRIDFAAYCLYGIWALAVMRSRIFEDRKWTLIAAIICAWLIATRFIVAAYAVGVMGVLVLYLLGGLFRYRRTPSRRTSTRNRLVNVGLFGLTVGALAGPAFYVARKQILSYYGGLHATGSERFIRAAEVGIKGFADHITYYPASVRYDHLGSVFLLLAASLTLGTLLLAGLRRRGGLLGADVSTTVLTAMVFLGSCIIVPFIILTIDISKSPVVGGIVGVPCALAIVAAIVFVGRVAFSSAGAFDLSSFSWAAMALVTMLAGGCHYVNHLIHHGPLYYRQQEIAQLTRIYDSIGKYTETVGWKNPALSMNTVADVINGRVVAVSYFERTGKLLQFRRQFGDKIFAVSRDEAIENLPKTDILVMQDLSKESFVGHPFPFYASILGLNDEIGRWADEHLVLLIETPSVYGAGFRVYVRPTMSVMGLSEGGCLTKKGIWFSGEGRIIRQRPLVFLEGSAGDSVAKTATLRAEVYAKDRSPFSIPAEFTVKGRKRLIRLDFSGVEQYLKDTVITKLTLNLGDEKDESEAGAEGTANAFCGFKGVRMEPTPKTSAPVD